VVVALYRRAAVRHAAIDRFLLQAAKFAAAARCWDRQTDGRTPCRFIDPAPSLPQIGDLITARKLNALINFATEYWYQGARIVYIIRQLHSLCYFHYTFYSYLR